MSLSSLEIQRVLGDLGFLSGALLKEVYQPSRTEFILALRTVGETTQLLFSVCPHLTRMHPVRQRPANPPKPLSFQSLCRKALGGRLIGLEQVEGDRVVLATFGGIEQTTIVAELTGRHGNLFLLDGGGRLLGAMLPFRNDRRGLRLGGPYVALPPPPSSIRPSDRFAERPVGQGYLEAVGVFFERASKEFDCDLARHALEAGIRRERKRLARRLRDLESDFQKAELAEQHRKFGDILQISLNEIPRGRSSVVIPDPFEGEAATLRVPLDPRLDPVRNVQRHYKLYRKYDASIPVVLERTEQTEARLELLERASLAIGNAQSLEALGALRKEFKLKPHVKGGRPALGKSDPARCPYLSFINPKGMEIWVGRSGKDNDRLTFREARGNDFWLHVRERPGAHVVVPARGKVPDLETLLDAASLAIRHSGLSSGDRYEVAYTRVKHVRRIPGAHPGLVTFSQDKTLYVELDAGRLSVLERTEGASKTHNRQ